MTNVQTKGLVTRETYQRTMLGSWSPWPASAPCPALLLPFRAHLSIAIPALVFVLPALLGVVIGGLRAGCRRRPRRLPPLRPLLPPAVQHADGPVARELGRPPRLRRGRAGRVPGRGQAAQRPGGSGAADRGVRAAVRTVAGADRRPQPVAAADAHCRHGAERLRATLDRADPSCRRPDGRTGRGAAGCRRAAGEPLAEGDVASVTSGGGQTPFARDVGRRRAPSGLGGAGGRPPAGRHAGAPGRRAGRSASAACSARSPTRPHWPSTGPSCPSRRCGPAFSRRSIAGAARSMGAASHDLRTPLASIKTAVSSLRQVGAQLSPADRDELLELIELQSDRLARLVTNLLDMTRMEAGALELRPDDARLRRAGRRGAGSSGGHRSAGPCHRRRAGGPPAPAHRPRAHEPGAGQPAGERGSPVA